MHLKFIVLRLKASKKSINKNGSRNIVRSFYYPDSTTVSKEINDEIQRNEDQDKIKVDQSIEATSFHVDDQEQLKINIAEKVSKANKCI